MKKIINILIKTRMKAYHQRFSKQKISFIANQKKSINKFKISDKSNNLINNDKIFNFLIYILLIYITFHYFVYFTLLYIK